MQRAFAYLAGGSLAVFALASASALADECRRLVRLTDLDHAVEPGVLVPATDAAPAHCRVRGVVNRAIRFEVTMPAENWNGRLLFSGVGGAAGVIGDTTSRLGDGFAMASTDTGHEAAEGNAYLNQPEALLDYAYRGVHLATGVAKRLIERYYGRPADYAYFHGCSNGGRAAMLEAIRFPDDYDGIVAGAPAFRFQEFAPWMYSVYKAQREHPLTEDALRLLDEASRSACDLIDGVEDGVLDDPRLCGAERLDLDALACADGRTEGCLSAGQIETARFIYSDHKDADGRVLSPGVPPGAEAAGDWAFWLLPSAQFEDGVMATVGDMLARLMRHDPTFDIETHDLADRARIDDATSPLDVRSADLAEFSARGGRLLIYQGWNDFPLRAGRAIDYLAEVQDANGGAEATAEFLRLFMVPGMAHCAGGPGPWQADWVDAVVAWREDGVVPDRIVGTQPGTANVEDMAHLLEDAAAAQTRRFTRPICPYPQRASYRGSGEVDDEANWDCVQ